MITDQYFVLISLKPNSLLLIYTVAYFAGSKNGKYYHDKQINIMESNNSIHF